MLSILHRPSSVCGHCRIKIVGIAVSEALTIFDLVEGMAVVGVVAEPHRPHEMGQMSRVKELLAHCDLNSAHSSLSLSGQDGLVTL